MGRMEELLANSDEQARLVVTTLEVVLLCGGLVCMLILLALHRRFPPDGDAINMQLSKRALSGLEIYGIVQLYFLLLFISMFTGRFFYEEQIPVAKLGIALVVYTAVSLAIFINNQRKKTTPSAGFGMGWRQLKFIGAAPFFYLAIVPALLSIGYLMKLTGYELPLQDNAQQFVESNPTERILFAAMAIVAAPFFEELLFRGVLFPAVLKRMGLTGATLLTSCLFAMMHFNFMMLLLVFTPLIIACVLIWPRGNTDATSTLPIQRNQDARRAASIFLMFITFGTALFFTFFSGSLHSFLSLSVLSTGVSLAYWRTGSLWTSIAMHALFNSVTLYTLNLAG